MAKATKAETETQTIVIAWTEETGLKKTGRTRFVGSHYVPVFDIVTEGYACIWLNAGSPSDVEKAMKYAAQEDKTVLTYPTTERDPLKRAKREILEVVS